MKKIENLIFNNSFYYFNNLFTMYHIIRQCIKKKSLIKNPFKISKTNPLIKKNSLIKRHYKSCPILPNDSLTSVACRVALGYGLIGLGTGVYEMVQTVGWLVKLHEGPEIIICGTSAALLTLVVGGALWPIALLYHYKNYQYKKIKK